MADQIVRAIAADGQLRAFAAVTTECVDEAQRRHQTLPTASAALGRAMTAGVLMGAMLKGEEYLTIQFIGDGQLRQVVVSADAKGNVRGYVANPLVHFPLNAAGKLDVARAVGKGTLHVIRDMGLKEPYRGSVPIVSGEIAEDMAYYLTRSEQTPSAVALGVLVNPDNTIQASGGYVLQVMPGASDEVISEIERRVPLAPAVSHAVSKGNSPEDLLYRLLGDMNLKILDQKPVQFKCECSKERLERALISLGPEELTDIIDNQGEAELTCHFCSERRVFSQEELESLRSEALKKFDQ